MERDRFDRKDQQLNKLSLIEDPFTAMLEGSPHYVNEGVFSVGPLSIMVKERPRIVRMAQEINLEEQLIKTINSEGFRDRAQVILKEVLEEPENGFEPNYELIGQRILDQDKE